MFKKTFEKINHIEKLKLNNNNCLEIYSLPIVGNCFDYSNLKDLITDNIKSYVFSRKKVKEAEKIGRGDSLFNEARKKFRTLKNENDKGADGIFLYQYNLDKHKIFDLVLEESKIKNKF